MSGDEADVGRLRTVPFGGRRNKVEPSLLARAPDGPATLTSFIDSLPDVLAARDLRVVVNHLVAAHGNHRGVVLLMGGHVIKTGLGPLISELVRRGVVSHVAMNGAAAIHDFELAAFGARQVGQRPAQRQVGQGLRVVAGRVGPDLRLRRRGTFGMVEETGSAMNAATREAAARGVGLGRGIAEALAGRAELPGEEASLLLACLKAGTGLTVHPAIGAEIIHQHPSFDGAALGDTAARDFRLLAGALPILDEGGAVLNFGSAVMMPEVFLKALTVARNLGEGRPRNFLAADFDMIRHYRPRMNVVQRPTRTGGIGVQITGHHEIMLPLLIWAVLERLGS